MTKKNFSCYCIQLRRAANFMTTLYDSQLRSLDISVTQYSLLSNIKDLGSCSVSDLAAYIDLERTTVVRTLKPLFQKGWIEDISSKDARNRKIIVTGKGETLLKQANDVWRHVQEEVQNRIGAEDLEDFERILAKLSE